MDEQKPLPPLPGSTEPETPIMARDLPHPGAGGKRFQRNPSKQSTTGPKVQIVVHVKPTQQPPSVAPEERSSSPDSPALDAPILEGEAGSSNASFEGQKIRRDTEPLQIPARMMNEFVYCQRLFYYEQT